MILQVGDYRKPRDALTGIQHVFSKSLIYVKITA